MSSFLISSLPLPTGATVVRDGAIQNLGMLKSMSNQFLAPIQEQRFLEEFSRNKGVSAVITNPALAGVIPRDVGLIVSDNPLETFFDIHISLTGTNYYWTDFETEIDKTTFIHPTAFVDQRNVKIGPGCRIGPNVIVLERTILGSGVVLHPGVVIGSEGFEVRKVMGCQRVIPHAGGAKIGNRVEIMANTVVDKALFKEFTEIGDDSVIDNLVHIAHAVVMGCRCQVAASAMIGGSVTMGDDVYIGPNATISNALRIGSGARVTLGSVVTRNVEPNGHVSGNFAIDHFKFLQFLRRIR